MKIALHMIVAGFEDPKNLERCIESVKGQVDGIFITVTSEDKNGLQKKAKELGCTVNYEPEQFFHIVPKKQVKWLKDQGFPETFSKVGDKVFQFDKARNFSMEHVPQNYGWLFWMDVDDVLRGNLREAAQVAERNKIECVYLNYIYQADIVDGKIKTVLIEHLRERLLRNNGAFKWLAPIHETLMEQRPTVKTDLALADVLHLSDQKRREDAIIRNVRALELSLWQTKAKDPRPIYYLGKSYFDLWMIEHKDTYLKIAKQLFERYLTGENQSGWKEERTQCWEYLMECYRSFGLIDQSIKAGHNAMIEFDQSPSTYLNLALSYLHKGEWDRAIFWVKIAAKIPSPKTSLVNNPRDLAMRSLEILYHASINLSKLDEAWAAAIKMVEIDPTNRSLVERAEFADKLRNQRDLTKRVIELAQYLETHGEGDKLKPLLMAAPVEIQDNPFMVELSNKVNPPRVWGENEVCLFVGPCFTQWSAKTIDNPGDKFIGGSEEAVIYLSQELVKQGWKVTVYGDPGAEEGEYDGVTYLPHYKFNPRDEFNIVISWRRPDFVDTNFKAKKTYIWAHDILQQSDFTKERMEKISKVIVLSPWHRSNLPDISDDKILISSNGI